MNCTGTRPLPPWLTHHGQTLVDAVYSCNGVGMVVTWLKTGINFIIESNILGGLWHMYDQFAYDQFVFYQLVCNQLVYDKLV